MIYFGYFIFLIILEILFYIYTAFHALQIFTLTILWHFSTFSIFTSIFFIIEIIFVHDLILYENNYFEKINIICHIFNILFIVYYELYVKKILKKQQEQCINLLG